MNDCFRLTVRYRAALPQVRFPPIQSPTGAGHGRVAETAKEGTLSRYVIESGGRQVGSIKTGFNAAVERAGIEHCTQHDLRRTAGRFVAEAGMPIDEIAQYLGHTNPIITRSTYSRFSPEYLRKAANALEFGSMNQSANPKTPRK
ncbi:tyrosine-type recombinase/integrase [Paracoccus onubensis]|uniref:Tyr recombinase domain-containing protein n=1 Tax=Paracoccus onubensis TaxID=1675788 RepID=A0A418T4J6_9RHOB|nr:tyrosine-type recombinase/integrase [Paracoccus onubensis]RJE88105.1 hypothetical protein D3P04_04110 [Paracoccus onubensis]